MIVWPFVVIWLLLLLVGLACMCGLTWRRWLHVLPFFQVVPGAAAGCC